MTSLATQRGPASELNALWQAALSRPFHSPACGCSVPSGIRIDAETFELDLLDYVEHKRGLRAMPAWCDALSRRERERVGSFADWLFTLKGAVIDDELHAVVIADIEASLRSMTEHAAGRLVPASALGAGWLGGGTAIDNDNMT